MFPAFKTGIFLENFFINFSSSFEKPVVPITTFFFNSDAILIISMVHFGIVKSIITSAPLISDFLNKESQANFNSIKETLERLKIPYIHDPKLVRGLDYYNDLVFEWKSNKLGSQDAVCAGGRYDNLSKTIGDKIVPSVGFAMGLDRIVELMEYESNALIIGLAVITNSNDESYEILNS